MEAADTATADGRAPCVDAVDEADHRRAPALPAAPTDGPQAASPRATVTRELVITGDRADQLWQMYHEAFAPLASLAMQQHLWTEREVLDELANADIVKFVGWQDDQPVGLCMVTCDLDAVPMISPSFLRRRYPEQASRNAIYYGIVIFVRAGYRGRTLFARLGTHAGQEAATQSGVIIFDVCSFNRERASLDDNLRRLAQPFPHSTMELLDQQSWFAIEVPEPLSDLARIRPRR